jgi:hypothetical protein
MGERDDGARLGDRWAMTYVLDERPLASEGRHVLLLLPAVAAIVCLYYALPAWALGLLPGGLP